MGVAEVVEHERPAGRAVAVGPDRDAVVRALALARVGDGRRCRAEGEADEGEDRDDRVPVAPAEAELERDARDEQQHARPDDQRPDRDDAQQHVAR